ncbi:uncharacterized protein [Ciconia boyciana]|uniref:uncharacterized protein n=1 Tax=Ciconia boyciana TaxID=52775 RepID=UPI003BA17639
MWMSARRGQDRCGGLRLLQHPGSFECHCAPGYAATPAGGCAAVMVNPNVCSKNQSGCELAETLTRLYVLLRGQRDPQHILQKLLATLDGAFEGGDEDVPRRHRRATALLAATEELVREVGALLPAADAAISSNSTELHLVVHQRPPPGPVHLQVPNVELDVPGEVARDSDTGRALVALLSQRRLDRVLEGAQKVRWEGWGDLPPAPGQESPLLPPPVPRGHRLCHPPPAPRLP